MVTRQELEGQWNQVKGKLQERWGALTDDELQRVKGNANDLIGVIQQRTGESRRAVEEFLSSAVSEGSGRAQQAVETAREYADQTMAAARQAYNTAYNEAAVTLNNGMDQAQQLVRRNPMESLAVAFGAGLITGVVAGLILKSR